MGHHVEVRPAECLGLCPHSCFPGERIEAYVEAIEVLAKANTVLSKFHTERRLAVESGASPTVKDSLDALVKDERSETPPGPIFGLAVSQGEEGIC